ncbi:MAG: PAS domain S-box protein, partial [Dehalococcoidia bacterium]|nr:PAS domain S-box protein [Dehalococcoidia bacterium]
MEEKARILIVDDDKSVSRSLSLILEKKGYCTQWAQTGKEALTKAKESAFNVALIDLRLPDTSGVELVEPLKKLNPNTALLIVTGYASLDTSVQAMDKGVSAYLIKPLSMDEVLQRVEDILTRQGLIEEKRQAEEALKDSEERYRGLFENSSEFLFTLDLEGSFTNVNKAAVELTGYTESELLKMNFKDYTPRNNHRKLFRAFYNVFKTGKPLKDFPVEAIIKDKTEKYFETNLSPLRKGDEIIGFQGSSKDITEQREAEQSIRKLSQFRESIIDNANVWLDVLDHKANIILWNKAAERISGYSQEEVVGHDKIWEWLYPDEAYRNEVTEQVVSILAKGATQQDLETTIHCKDGQQRI